MHRAKWSICLLSTLVLSACGSSSSTPEGNDTVGPTETTSTAGTGTSSAGTGTGTAGTGTATGGTGTGGTATDGTGTGGTATGGTGTGGGEPEDVFPPVYETPADVAACSVDDIKHRVDFDMRDYYIYYDQVPVLNLGDYDSGNALIRDLRVSPDRFSSVRDQAATEDLFSEGRQGGFGFGFQPAVDGPVRITRVLVGSPAYRAGIIRGDEVLSVAGISIDDITNEQIGVAFDPDNSPVVISLQTGDEEPRTVSVEFEDYRWITAGPWNRYTSSSDPSLPAVGYLQVDSFLETTTAEINSALSQLADAGEVTELILDLRYNGGGLVDVSRYLASIIGGEAVEDEVFTSALWNDKYADFNQSFDFVTVTRSLNLSRLIVLSTENTASASELLANSLEPFIDVIMIGEKSAGKPFASNLLPYCDKSISAMRSVLANAVGVDVGSGIEADCLVADTWLAPRDAVSDPLVSTALNYVVTGVCGDQPLASAPSDLRNASANSVGYELQEYLPDVAID